MYDQNNNVRTKTITREDAEKAFVGRVFTYLTAALAITGLASFWFGTNVHLMEYLIDPITGGRTLLGWVTLLAPLGFVLFLGKAIQKLSAQQMLIALLVYSAVMGISLSFIFMYYTMGSIANTFFICSATFGVMAVLGYKTKTDLTGFGMVLRMAVVGLIIAMVVNMFLGSSMMDYIISGVGVLIFTGLTAYDMQMIRKNAAEMLSTGSEMASKLAMASALNLYLDFINLFLMLLRFSGGSRN